jgi:hypothetical protein
MGNFGNRLAQSFLIGLGLALATYFGIGFGTAVAIFTPVQQWAGTGAMFFFGLGIGIAKDTGENSGASTPATSKPA